MKKFFKEFKAFISKGNVFDMAVGLIIATAFNKIVSSMVNDIIMPLVTWATGAKNLADLSIVLRETVEADGTITKLTWQYGNFLQAVIDFLIIAFSVFVMVKVVSASRKGLHDISGTFVKLGKKEVKEDWKNAKKIAKAEKRKVADVYKELEQKRIEDAKEQARLKEEEKKQKEAEERRNNPTETDLLKEIRDLLKNKE